MKIATGVSRSAAALTRVTRQVRAGSGLGHRAQTQIIGLDHVQVAAPIGSESEARRFYGGLLGLSELRKPRAGNRIELIGAS